MSLTDTASTTGACSANTSNTRRLNARYTAMRGGTKTADTPTNLRA